MRRFRLPAVMGLLLTAATLLACSGSPAPASHAPSAAPPSASPAASPAPTASAAPTVSPPAVVSVTSTAQAAALVLASDARFEGTGPLYSDMIGLSRWYEASQTADGYSVSVTLGAGDCQAGCIERHTWSYSVSPEGAITFVSEDGDQVDTSPPVSTDGPATISVRVEASPTCPVERVPPDPQCAPRPVASYEVVLRQPSGNEVARSTTGADGSLAFSVPAGSYYIEPVTQSVIGGLAEGSAFSVVGGQTMAVVVSVDTGIR